MLVNILLLEVLLLELKFLLCSIITIPLWVVALPIIGFVGGVLILGLGYTCAMIYEIFRGQNDRE